MNFKDSVEEAAFRKEVQEFIRKEAPANDGRGGGIFAEGDVAINESSVRHNATGASFKGGDGVRVVFVNLAQRDTARVAANSTMTTTGRGNA